MKLILDEWIVREVIDTLYMARTTFLGITGLDSPQEVAKKSSKETAITRRISKAIDIIQQSEQPKINLKKEVKAYIKDNFTITDEVAQIPEEDRRCSMWEDDMVAFARHFYELGLNARKEE